MVYKVRILNNALEDFFNKFETRIDILFKEYHDNSMSYIIGSELNLTDELKDFQEKLGKKGITQRLEIYRAIEDHKNFIEIDKTFYVDGLIFKLQKNIFEKIKTRFYMDLNEKILICNKQKIGFYIGRKHYRQKLFEKYFGIKKIIGKDYVMDFGSYSIFEKLDQITEEKFKQYFKTYLEVNYSNYSGLLKKFENSGQPLYIVFDNVTHGGWEYLTLAG